MPITTRMKGGGYDVSSKEQHATLGALLQWLEQTAATLPTRL